MKRSKKREIELTPIDPKIPSDSAIFLENLSFGYETNKLNIKKVNVDIKKGQSIAFIGHNGSGKSTLAKLIDGILVQNRGDIYIFGVKMTDDNALILRRDIGLVFQNPDSQFIGATVRDDIAFGLENACVDPSKMNDIILDCATKVGMQDYLDAEPSHLILDEAGAMLDPKGKRQIRNIIKERKKENPDLTIINITHEIDDAYDSDRVLVMNGGQLILDDKPEVVFDNDELLKQIHLDIPFAHKLAKDLKEEGMDLGLIKNDEELYKKLCQ